MKTCDLQNRRAACIRFPIRAKMLVAFVGLALLPMLFLTLLVSDRAERFLTDRIAQELSIEVATAADTIEVYLAGVRRDDLSLARFLERRLKRRMTEAEWRGVEEEFLRTMEAEQAYYQVRFIAADGMESIRVNNEKGRLRLVPREGLQYKGDRYYFREALATPPGTVYLSPLDFNVEYGRIEEPRRLVARVATPVRDDSGRVRGAVVINVFGEELLGTLARLRPFPGIRVLLLDEAGRFVEMEEAAQAPRFRAGTQKGPGGIHLPPPETKTGEIVRATGDTLLASAPVHTGPGSAWRLVKIYPRAFLFADIAKLHRAIIFLAFPMLLLAAGLAILAARSFSRPIQELSRFAGEVAAGDCDSRSAIASQDEMGELAAALNDMAGSLAASRERLEEWNRSLQDEVARKVDALQRSEAAMETTRKGMQDLERQLIQADRLASLGMLSATVAHEIGNPLAGLKMRLQMLLRKNVEEAPMRGELERMLALVDRLAEFLTHLTGYVTATGARERTVDLVQALQELEFILREEADRRGITLFLDLPPSPLPVCTPGQHLHQVFMNLILNALQAAGEGGRVSVVAEREGKMVRATVRDTGPGLPEGSAEQLFEPLYTTKEQGTGLGLAIVKQLVNELGGTIRLANHPEGGAVAEVLLPERETECSRES